MDLLVMLPAACLAPHCLSFIATRSLPLVHCRRGVDVMDLLVTLTTKQGVALLNSTQVGRHKASGTKRPCCPSFCFGALQGPPSFPAAALPPCRPACTEQWLAALIMPAVLLLPSVPSQDYSFLETPELPLDTNSTIIPRRALPNPRIPAFLEGKLVWGQLPTPPANASAPAAAPGVLGGRSGTAMALGGNASGNGSVPSLPAGITCSSVQDGKGQNCGWVFRWSGWLGGRLGAASLRSGISGGFAATRSPGRAEECSTPVAINTVSLPSSPTPQPDGGVLLPGAG